LWVELEQFLFACSQHRLKPIDLIQRDRDFALDLEKSRFHLCLFDERLIDFGFDLQQLLLDRVELRLALVIEIVLFPQLLDLLDFEFGLMIGQVRVIAGHLVEGRYLPKKPRLIGYEQRFQSCGHIPEPNGLSSDRLHSDEAQRPSSLAFARRHPD